MHWALVSLGVIRRSSQIDKIHQNKFLSYNKTKISRIKTNTLAYDFNNFTVSQTCMRVQSTPVISTSLISNNRLSRSENLVPVYQQAQYFQYISTLGVELIFILLKVVVRLIVFLSSANLIYRSTDISKCFIESLGFPDNESRLYILVKTSSRTLSINQ